MVAAGKSSFLFQAGAHGTTGGAMSAIEGGNFVSGFAAGAMSSIISSGVQGIAKNLSTNLRDAITIASGGLSGGISSSIAGGNFWRGVKQGLITSGLNHVAHNFANGLSKSKVKPLADYENDIDKAIYDRSLEINKDLIEQYGKLRNASNRRQQRRAKAKLQNLNNQKVTLNSAKKILNYLIHKKHGYTLNASTSGVPSGAKGTLKWGGNNKSILLAFNGNIRVLIHEMIHAYDVITRPNQVHPYSAGARIKLKSLFSEINAWKTTYSLRNNDVSVNNILGIDEKFVKTLGY